METNFSGKEYGFQGVDIWVNKNDWIRISASGWINTKAGEAVDPNGADTTGKQYDAVDDVFGQHPSTKHKKYALLLKVGDFITAAGKDLMIQCPDEGRLELAMNDNFVSDNSGFWTVKISSGSVLTQKQLFVIQNPVYDVKKIKEAINYFCSEVFDGSGGLIKIEPTVLECTDPFDPTEFETFDSKNEYAPLYRSQIITFLENNDIDPTQFHGIFRLYVNPVSAPSPGITYPAPLLTSYAGVTFSKDTAKKLPHYAIILLEQSSLKPGVAAPLSNIILHEYLHIVDMRFGDISIANFANPDGLGENKIPYEPLPNDEDKKRSYYRNMLRLMEDLTPPPYGKLDGTFGSLN